MQVPIMTFTTQNIAESNTSTIVQQTYKSIDKVDNTLTKLSPILIEIKNYTLSKIVTVIYETEGSNSRIVGVSTPSGEVKIVDYSKIAKVVVPSVTVESQN